MHRLFASHADWMAKSHHKDGPLALLSYSVGKGAELANPLDPIFILYGEHELCSARGV